MARIASATASAARSAPAVCAGKPIACAMRSRRRSLTIVGALALNLTTAGRNIALSVP